MKAPAIYSNKHSTNKEITMNDIDALKRLYKVIAAQDAVLKRLAQHKPWTAEDERRHKAQRADEAHKDEEAERNDPSNGWGEHGGQEWPEAINGTRAPEQEWSQHKDQFDPDEDVYPLNPEDGDEPFDENVHSPSAPHGEGAIFDDGDDPIPNLNTRKTFKFPNERLFKFPDEDDEDNARDTTTAALHQGIAKLAQMADVEGFLKRALNTAIGNVGGIHSQFNTKFATQGDRYVLTATFMPNLGNAVEEKVGHAFYQYVNNNPALVGKVELVINRTKNVA